MVTILQLLPLVAWAVWCVGATYLAHRSMKGPDGPPSE